MIFFISVLFASITSLMNLLEVPIEAVQSTFKLKRKLSVFIVVGAAFIFGLFAEDGNNLGVLMDFVSIYIIPIGAFIAAVMFFWVIGIEKAKYEIECGTDKKLGKLFEISAKYVFCIFNNICIYRGNPFRRNRIEYG